MRAHGGAERPGEARCAHADSACRMDTWRHVFRARVVRAVHTVWRAVARTRRVSPVQGRRSARRVRRRRAMRAEAWMRRAQGRRAASDERRAAGGGCEQRGCDSCACGGRRVSLDAGTCGGRREAGSGRGAFGGNREEWVMGGKEPETGSGQRAAGSWQRATS
ncbi:hypothetical protein GGX14DRAFT_405692 [Mycena pura]|uniref:Uncharacterized protein n=1 Tax=Mycena pura TaxID=153505 RepID=A0AAD6URT6_9AGAR|nr:hypothetical protein GGX14DRAFT_405692 [Mycena pura]